MACLPPQVWDGVLRRLQDELPPFAVEAWLEPLVVRSDADGLCLECPTPLHRRRVEERFRARIEECLSRELGRVIPVRTCLASPAPDPGRSREADPPAVRESGSPEAAPAAASRAPRARTLAPPPQPRQATLPHTFESFVVGNANALAREAAWALAHRHNLSLSPLYLASPPGLGKTHLARAVVAEARAQGLPGAVYASAEQFTSELVTSLRARRMAEFKQRYRRDCRLLVLEDVQFLAGKQATQLELFHTLEFLRDVGAPVVLTGSRLPRELEGIEASLASRLGCGLVAEIEPPDATLRREILRAKAAAGGVRLPADCLERLVEAVPGSVRDLESSLIQLVATSSLLKRPIDLELTEAALRKLAPQPASLPRLEPRQVVEAVAAFFGISPEALASRSRRRAVLVPRQIAMYLCRRYTQASLKEIGRSLGRDHPSVTNAIAAVERALLERAPLRYQVEALIERLEAKRS